MDRLRFLQPEELHYSACFSLSKSDAQKINELILKNLESNSKIIEKSKEEVAYVYSFDFYPLIG